MGQFKNPKSSYCSIFRILVIFKVLFVDYPTHLVLRNTKHKETMILKIRSFLGQWPWKNMNFSILGQNNPENPEKWCKWQVLYYFKIITKTFQVSFQIFRKPWWSIFTKNLFKSQMPSFPFNIFIISVILFLFLIFQWLSPSQF